MKPIADLVDTVERLQDLAAEALAQCTAARARLEEIRRSEAVDHAQVLTGLAQLRARLQTTEAPQ
jgi:hypothetical protein